MVLIAAAAALLAPAVIDPQYAQNITVYHLNPRSAGGLPINMDTGDAAGDLNFYLGEFLLPIECTNASHTRMKEFDCDNPERVDPNLVVTKVVMSVDKRFTTYSACNLCNGTDPMGHGKTCTVGQYVCDCEQWGHSGGRCDPTKVGAQSRNQSYPPSHHTPPPTPPPPPKPTVPCTCSEEYPYCWNGGYWSGYDYSCYKSYESNNKSDTQCVDKCTDSYTPPEPCENAIQKACGDYQGHGSCPDCLYEHRSELGQCSTADKSAFCSVLPKGGNDYGCGSTNPTDCWQENVRRKTGGYWYSTLKDGLCNSSGLPCSWQPYELVTIPNLCLKSKLIDAGEKAGDAACFESCGPRNTTSTCWIGCFMDSLLGKDARNSTSHPLGGMPMTDIIASWESAFLPENEGGCPRISLP